MIDFIGGLVFTGLVVAPAIWITLLFGVFLADKCAGFVMRDRYDQDRFLDVFRNLTPNIPDGIAQFWCVMSGMVVTITLMIAALVGSDTRHKETFMDVALWPMDAGAWLSPLMIAIVALLVSLYGMRALADLSKAAAKLKSAVARHIADRDAHK